jgi:hypothetical protein
MMTRRAACSCGQLRLEIEGEPSRVSMCHCMECQRRTGAVITAAWLRTVAFAFSLDAGSPSLF